jgi:hypothetical protein
MEVKKDLIGKKTPSVAEIAKKHGLASSALRGQMAKGSKVEREHTKSDAEAKEIARDHLDEFPDYYTRLAKMEKDAKKSKSVKEDVGRGNVDSRVDALELLHNANRERILKGAKEGKFWLLRSESVNEGVGMIAGAFTSTRDRHIMQNMPRFYSPNNGVARKGKASGGQATSVITGPREPWQGDGVSGALGSGTMNESARRDLIKRIIETTMTGNIGTFNVGLAPGDIDRKRDGAFGARNKMPKEMLKNAVSVLTGRKSIPPTVT